MTQRSYAIFMQQALELAQQAQGEVEPNPLVGALVLHEEKVVAKGWHRFYGGKHAEVEALAKVNGKGDCLVVSLEPCSTSGKTPACTNRILQSGIRKVIVGAIDPNPAHQGKGIQILRQAGCEVAVLDFQQAWEQQNQSFLRFLQQQRPWVIAKWAMTLDGKLAAASGDARYISCEESRTEVWQLRGRCEAIITGVATILQDNPQLTPRQYLTLTQAPLRVVLDSQLRTPIDSVIVKENPQDTLIIASRHAEKQRVDELQKVGCEVVLLGQEGNRPRIADVLDLLFQRKMNRVLLEAGGRLTGAFLAQGYVDQVIVYVAPKIIGGPARHALVNDSQVARMADAAQLHNVQWRKSGSDIKLVGFVD